ncbi:META domain-containing protein [Streptomyces sp. NPDC126499]|uniref:META domain-containing protein n=1 Tax=Streptomyces sp. NPDC126499 TaxID=3155314 RepID=UPI003319F1B4
MGLEEPYGHGGRPIGMQKPRTLTAALTVFALALLSACGTEPGTGPGAGGDPDTPDLPVAGSHWTIAAVTVDGARSVAPPGARLEVEENGRAKGNTGCNSFGAAVAVNGDTLTVSTHEVTLIGCPADRDRFERAFLKAFTGKLEGKTREKGLTLTSPDGRKVLELVAEPGAPLVGTSWTVDALLSGETSASLPAGSEGKAKLAFGKDGRLSGSLGCNRVSAPATISGKTITLGAIATTRMICTGPQMELETKLYEALDGPLTYRLDHRTLTVTDVDGQGFTARAETFEG